MVWVCVVVAPGDPARGVGRSPPSGLSRVQPAGTDPTTQATSTAATVRRVRPAGLRARRSVAARGSPRDIPNDLRSSAADEALGEVGGDPVEADPLLLHRVALAHRH